MDERRGPARWTMVAAGVVIVLLVAGGAAALAARPHTGRLLAPSESMAPTLPVHTTFTVDYDAYEDAAPRIGDIVVFHPPAGAEQEDQCGGGQPPRGQMCARPTRGRADVRFVKRVVAGPGDRVAVVGGRVLRNGRRITEPYTEPCRGGEEGCDFPVPITVPAGQYVVLGDNRGSSDDSRFWGPVRREWLLGRVDRCNALGFHCRARR